MTDEVNLTFDEDEVNLEFDAVAQPDDEVTLEFDGPTDLASLAGDQGEVGADWANLGENAKSLAGVAIPVATSLGAAALTSGASLPIQLGAAVAGSLVGGAGGRMAVGEDPLKAGGPVPFVDEPGWIQDLEAATVLPAVFNTGRRIYKGISRPAASAEFSDYLQALKTESWKPFPKVRPVKTTAKLPEAAPIRRIASILANAETAATRSNIPEMRDIGERIGAVGHMTRRFEQDVHDYRSTLAKLSSTEQELVTDILEGAPMPANANPKLQAAVSHGRGMYSEHGDIGVKLGIAQLEADPTTGKLVRRAFTKHPLFAGPDFEKGTGPTGFLAKMRAFVSDKAVGQTTVPPPQSLSQVARSKVVRGHRPLQSYQRKGMIPPDKLERNQLLRLNEYERRYKPTFATTYAFGPTVDSKPGRGLYEFGRDVNRLLGKVAASQPAGKELATAHTVLRHLNDMYRTPAPLSPGDEIANFLTRISSKVLLPTTWATQQLQHSTNLWNYGFGNTVEGLARYAKDPSYRALIKAGGGPKPGLVQYLERSGGAGTPWWKAPGPSATAAAERGLRSWSSAGAIPYAEEVLGSAAKYQSAGRALPAGLLRQGREMGVDLTQPYTPSASLFRDTTKVQVHRLQFNSLDPGQADPWMTSNPVGRLVTQFGPFGLDQARLARDRLLYPLAQGTRTALKTGDMSDLGLGLTRLARLGPAVGVGYGARELGKSIHQLRMPRWDPWAAASSTFGTLAELASSAAHNDPFERAVPPYVSLAENPYRAALALDPTGWASFLSPPFTVKRRPEDPFYSPP